MQAKQRMCEQATDFAVGRPRCARSGHVSHRQTNLVHDLTPERFATAKSFSSTAPELQEKLRGKLKIPSFFFDRTYLQSSGFCGYDVWLDKNEEVEFYSMW
jgi:hypothetical protein